MTTTDSPRARFVEAMRYLWERHECDEPESDPCRFCVATEDACDAFADALCRAKSIPDGGWWSHCPTGMLHDACRAALRKECGL